MANPTWDKDGNGIPDSIQAPNPTWDKDGNGIPDMVQAPVNPTWDQDGNGIPDMVQAPTPAPAPLDSNILLGDPNTPSYSGGGGGGGGTQPSYNGPPLPYNVAKNSGLSGADINTVLNKALLSYNTTNGTDFQLNDQGHIRQGGSGAYMSADQQIGFNDTIPLHAVSFKYEVAKINAAMGNPTELQNLDMFFGNTRPAEEYTQAFYAHPGFNEQKYLAANPDVAAAVASGQISSGLAHYFSSGESEGRQSDFSESTPAPAPAPDVPVATSAPEPTPEPAAPPSSDAPEVDAPGDVVQPDTPGTVPEAPEGGNSSSETNPEAPNETSAEAQAQQDAKQAEGLAKAAAAQAEADEKKQEALVVATAAKDSAKESRMKKLMSMRKPWSSGGASSSTGSDAMVAPSITPSSQIPPPPL